MAEREKLDRIARQLFLYLGSNYPAKITTANSERKARITGYAKENFTIASGATLALDVEGTAKTVSITSGTRTAAQVATDINGASIGVTAADDGKGRVRLTSDTAPVSGQPSHLRITEATSGDVGSSIGLEPGLEDVRALISTPGPRGFIIGPYQYLPMPHILMRSMSLDPDDNTRSELDDGLFEIQVRDYDAGGNHIASVELMQRHLHIIDEIIEDDRTGEGQWVFSEVERKQVEPNIFDLVTQQGQQLTVAEAALTIRVRVYQY